MGGCLEGNGILGKEATTSYIYILGSPNSVRPAPVLHQTQTNLNKISPDLSQVTKKF